MSIKISGSYFTNVYKKTIIFTEHKYSYRVFFIALLIRLKIHIKIVYIRVGRNILLF